MERMESVVHIQKSYQVLISFYSFLTFSLVNFMNALEIPFYLCILQEEKKIMTIIWNLSLNFFVTKFSVKWISYFMVK
jgi:hypothetical protein